MVKKINFECPICYFPVNETQLKRHQKCFQCKSFRERSLNSILKDKEFYSNEASEVLRMDKNKKDFIIENKALKEELVENNIEISNHRRFQKEITTLFNDNQHLIKQNNLRKNPDDAIKKLDLKNSTMKTYTSYWKKYLIFCKENRRSYNDINSANTFISSLNYLAVSTKKSVKNYIQSILRTDLEVDVNLKKIKRRRQHLKEKLFVDKDSIMKFLKETKQKNIETFAIFFIICEHVVRPHTVSGIKKEHLRYNSRGDIISMFLPTTKSDPKRVNVSKDFSEIIKEILIKNKVNKNKDFLFKAGNSFNLDTRANTFQRKINLIIKNCKTFQEYEKKQLTSYLFRRSIANEKNEIYKEALMKTSKFLGHRNNISNVRYYLKDD